MELDQELLYVKEVRLQRVEESPGLEMFRRGTAYKLFKFNKGNPPKKVKAPDSQRNPVLLNDIPNPVSIRRHGSEPKEAQSRVSAV